MDIEEEIEMAMEIVQPKKVQKSSAPYKFTDDEICYIRHQFHQNGISKKTLAKQFDVSWNSIHYIIIRKFYADVA
ncbi:hypothetical protein ASG65_26445 [Bacillus sp. Leaf13]|nr:hypothetical protein ASG65_26445 [Bacillus sp. Leaf13]